MAMVYALLLLLGLVCFALATFNVVSRINLVAAGLFLVFLVPFFQELRRLL